MSHRTIEVHLGKKVAPAVLYQRKDGSLFYRSPFTEKIVNLPYDPDTGELSERRQRTRFWNFREHITKRAELERSHRCPDRPART